MGLLPLITKDYKNMKEFNYFNPHRENHLEFAEYLQDSMKNIENVKVISMGNHIQSIFIDNKYYMTLDWLKI